MTAPEFSRAVRLDTLGTQPRPISISAEETERTALARRFGLEAIETLSADAELSRSGEVIRARGCLQATVIQSCIATGAPVEAQIKEAFRIEFRREPQAGDEEVELGESELDVVFYAGAAVDLGEAVAESLLLALDPYPRCPGANDHLAKAGVVREGEEQRTGPLAGLKELLNKGRP